MNKSNVSKALYSMRFFAILFVIVAHVNRGSQIYNVVAMLGVPIFLIIAGYYYHGYTNALSFFKSKISTIIIPWIIASLITFSLHVIKGGNLSIFEYFKWFIGYNTFYYYLTVYMLFIVFYKYIYKNNSLIILSMLFGFSSILFTQLGYFNIVFLTPYLNPLNWCIYFSFGIVLKQYQILEKMNTKFFMFTLIISIIFFFLCYNTLDINYFNVLSIVLSINIFLVLFFILCSFDMSNIINFIGKCSLFIYMYHMQIVQFLCWHLPNNSLINIINPFIGLATMVILLYIILFLYKKWPIINNLTKLIGLDFKKMGV